VPYDTNPYDPMDSDRPSGGGCRRYAIGCGAIVLVVVLLAALILYLLWPSLIDSAVQRRLAEYRDAVQKMKLDPAVRDELVGDFNTIRLSIDDHDHFGFSQWGDVRRAVDKLFADGEIDAGELGTLRSEINRMKKIQNINAK
jgi:hypothetical protein